MTEVAVVPKQEEYHKAFTGCLTDDTGVKRWFVDGAYSREGGLPAIECPDGEQHWYVLNPKRGGGFGQRDAVEHREGGPAVIRANGDKFWYNMGKLDRVDGPAVELANGTNKWFEKDKFIRMANTEAAGLPA
jgi:hypothetical protein